MSDRKHTEECERCGHEYPFDTFIDVGGQDCYDQLCEDCADQLIWDDEEEED